MKIKEYRAIKLTDLQVRANEENSDELIIEGYFSLFDDETELWNGYYEKILKGAFDNSLKGNYDIRALFNHDTAKVLGRTKSKTLTLRVDEKGLFGKIIINKNDTEALNLYYRVQRGDIDQCSFGFYLDEEDYTVEMRNGEYHSSIKNVDLFEVSIVTFPAYANTSVEARHKSFEDAEQRSFKIWKKQLLERFGK